LKFIFLTLLLSHDATKHDPAPVLELTQKARAFEATLDTTLPSEAQTLRTDLELSLIYPRTVSLDHLSGRSLEILARFHAPQTEVVVDWATQATLAWLKIGKIERATKSLVNCFEAMINLLKQNKPKILLSVYEQLGGELSNFPSGFQALVHSSMAWAHGQLGESSEAHQLCMQAYAEWLAAGETPFAAFCLGWAARHTSAMSGLDAVWSLLDEHLQAVSGHADKVIPQLGDTVADVSQNQGAAVGFALGVALLDGLAARPQLLNEAVLRALWIKMVDKGVPHGLLRDLLDEWPHLFDHQAHPSLSDLNRLLSDWLDDLDTPPAQRETRRLTLDPDLATTLTALAANRSQSTQQKLGLAPPTPGTP
jgi:hypothetical protein